MAQLGTVILACVCVIPSATCSVDGDAVEVSDPEAIIRQSTTTESASTTTARLVAVPLIVDGGSPHGRVRPAPDPPSTSTTPAPVTEPPWPTGIDYGPTEIDPIPFEYVEEWRPLVAVWFRPEDVDRVLAIIECESSGRWNAVGPEIKHLDMRALGLLQHLDGYWLDRAEKADAAGYTNYGDVWSPTDQLAVGAYLAYGTPQGFGHWVCAR